MLQTIEQKIENAQLFVAYFGGLLKETTDEDAVEDLHSLLTVANAYIADLQRLQARRKMDAECYINTRNSRILASILLEEMRETEDLSGWYMGCDPGESMLYAVATFLCEAHLQLVDSTMLAKNKPVTDEQLAAIARLLK